MAQVPPTYVHHPFCYGHYSPLQTPSHKPNATGDLHCAVPTAGQEDLGALAKPPARKGRSADGRSTCTSETVPSRWRSCLFTIFFPLNKVPLHPILRRLHFLSFPKALPTSPATSQGSTGHSGGWKRGSRTSLRQDVPSNNNTARDTSPSLAQTKGWTHSCTSTNTSDATSPWHHTLRFMEKLRLEEALKIIASNRSPNTAQATTKPCP